MSFTTPTLNFHHYQGHWKQVSGNPAQAWSEAWPLHSCLQPECAEGLKKGRGGGTTLYTWKSYSAKLKNALREFSWDLIKMASGEKGLDGTHCCDLDSTSQSPGVSLWKWHEVPVCHRDSVKGTCFVNSSVHPPRNKSNGGEKK